MATRSDRATDEFFAKFEGIPTPKWTTVEDLGRVSIESLHSDPLVRTGRSLGSVHLAGDAARDHSARSHELGRFLVSWQRLLNAIGGSLEGAKGAVGPLSRSVIRRTAIRVDSRFAPGSVVLHVFAESDPSLELRPRGEMFDIEGNTPLVDRAIEELTSLVGEVDARPPGGDAPFVVHLRELGPRVANAVRNLAQDIHEAGFDMDLEWEPPSRPTSRVSISSVTAGFIESMVDSKRLDAEEITVVATMRTPSDRPSKWEVDTVQYGLIRVSHDQIPPVEAIGLAVGMQVELRLDRIPVRKASGETEYLWEATRINRVDE